MSSENTVLFSSINKKKLVDIIEALKIDLLANENKMEDILKDTSNFNDCRLENQINLCFELHCKIEDYLEKLKELESKDNYTELSNTILIDFISNISNVKNDSGPEALIIVTSEKVGNLYIQLIRRLALKNVIITTIRALTAGDVRHVTLSYVKTALIDGSDEDYGQFVGAESIRLVVSDHVPDDKLFFIRDDVHRKLCFEQALQKRFTQ